MPRTLYARLVLVLVLLFSAVGLLYTLISSSATRHYLDELNQQLNRDLARNLVADRNLVAEGRLDRQALNETFQQYMVINPSIEIYLLDLQGRILAYSADPGKVKRKRVSLEPITRFLEQAGALPLLGDDPRSHDRRKAFSVTQVPSSENPEGYLYVVLRGEQFEAADKMVRESLFLRLSGWSVAASLVFGLLAGLLLFRLLTRRLQRLSRLMAGFDRSGFRALPQPVGTHPAQGDEVDRLGVTFERMALRIQDQFGQLEQQDSLRRQLVAQVSHDLRTPLTSLQGYLESLALKGDQLPQAERSEYLDIAMRQSRRLSRQLDELFQLASLDARESQPQIEPFPPAELLQDVAQKYQLRARERGVSLRLEEPAALPFVLGDIGMTERALENLLENAFTHTPEGGVIELSAQRVDGMVEVRIRDSGSGFPPEDIAQIFEPFYRVEDQRQLGRHAGLGLAIARRICELQGGGIAARNRPEGGAEFAFTLPVAAA